MAYVRPLASFSVSISVAVLGCSASPPSVSHPAQGVEPGSRAPRALLAPAREGAVATGVYRNLFAELGKPSAEIDAKVAGAYRSLFHGSADEVVMFDAGRNARGPLAYVYDVGNGDVGEAYPSTYRLDGTPTDHDHSLGLVATNAVAALAANDPRAARFVEALYAAEPPTGKWRYYNGMLYMLALLHASGHFRAYMPPG